ncbi:MAG: ribonuclease D [Gammaproteobacteria bacterium]|nr:ribonuclease D [Gammaproteobacteria bacterium]
MELIDSENRLRHLVNDWQACEWIAIDTEFMRYQTYYPILCLIQAHSKFGTVGIDTLSIKNLNVLGRLFECETTTLILHACFQDLEALARRGNFMFNGLFDTQIAAAFCGYSESVGYSSIVNDLCGVVIDKDQTRSDWSKRPLTSRQLDYARNDVIYLDQIHNTLESEMEQSGKIEWFGQECKEVAKQSVLTVKPEDVWHQFSSLEVPDSARNIARELVIWRERLAQKWDRPRGWVLSNQTVIELCFRRPKKINQLWNIPSLSKGNIKKFGHVLIEIVRKHGANFSNQDNASRVLLDQKFKKDVKEAKKMVRSIAREYAISDGLLGSRKDIELFLRGEPRSRLMKGWRYELIGSAMEERFGRRVSKATIITGQPLSK